jgi:hypothetical protein
MKFFLLLFLITGCAAFKERPNKIVPFTTDGCSMYPDGVLFVDSNRWVHCCIVHDIAYWIGGNHQEKIDADYDLGMCVAEKSSSIQGDLMSSGTRFGGVANNILPWAWGYGWSYNRGYRKLREKDLQKVFAQFDSVLSALMLWTKDLSVLQKSTIIGQIESIRYDLEQKLPEEKRGHDSFETRSRLIQAFLEGKTP